MFHVHRSNYIIPKPLHHRMWSQSYAACARLFLCLVIYHLILFVPSDVSLEQRNSDAYPEKWHARSWQDSFQEAENSFGPYDAQTNKGMFISLFSPCPNVLFPRLNAQMILDFLHERLLFGGITSAQKRKSCTSHCFLTPHVSLVPTLILERS